VLSPEAAKALQLVKQQIRAGRARIERRVDRYLESEKLDADDVWQALNAAVPGDITDYSSEHQHPERMTLELGLKVEGDNREFYCKVSVNVNVNHDPMVLSFKPSGT